MTKPNEVLDAPPERIWIAPISLKTKTGTIYDEATKQDDDVEYVRASLASEWRDIATAPKDSSWILGLTLAGRQVVVRWGGGAWEDDNRLCRDPLHWMPLPPLPAERENKNLVK